VALAEEALAGERFENMTERVPSGGKAVLALSALVMIWGYNWVVMKVALQYSSPFDYAALRVLLGGISLFLVLIWLRKPLLPKEVSGTFLAGFLQTSGFYGLSTLALVSGGAGKTAVLNYAMPFWVVLLAWFVLGEQLQKVQLFGVAIALAGLLFILMPFSLAEGLFSKGLALLSSVSWAVGIIVSKKLQQKGDLDLLSFTTWQMLFGSIPLILLAFFIPSASIIWSIPFISVMIYSVILGNAVAWLLCFYALSRLPAGMAGLGMLGAPVVGVLTAWIQLGEKPTLPETIGIVLIISALVLNSAQAMKPLPRCRS
jgi:drug/metabolite transporter (DMT)-like permease